MDGSYAIGYCKPEPEFKNRLPLPSHQMDECCKNYISIIGSYNLQLIESNNEIYVAQMEVVEPSVKIDDRYYTIGLIHVKRKFSINKLFDLLEENA